MNQSLATDDFVYTTVSNSKPQASNPKLKPILIWQTTCQINIQHKNAQFEHI